MSSAFVETVTKYFEGVTDLRVNRGQNYPLIEMVFVALCGSICDCNSWVDVSEFGHAKLAWFRKFLPFKLGVPSHDTFSEVFARLDILDVTFTEDSSRIRRGTGPEISSVFRRLALTILQQDTSIKGSLRGKRKICGWDESAFERLLAGFADV